jgi:DNA polymerase III subunit gamma/tau
MQALYRKYRSKSLKEVVGQEHITATLASAIASGRVSHAYLFTGPRGVGKTSVARILAHEINNLPYTDEMHLDIIEIDAASNRRIDDIRDLRDKVHIAPTSAKYKVYIIDEAHMLTGESFNALLKTLEEPPAHAVFILATTEAHKIPATIISRTQRYSFRPVEPGKITEHLKYIASKEKIAIDDEALALVAEHGDGSFRDSISLLDQLANIAGGTITAQTVEQNLGLAPRKSIAALVESIKDKDRQAITEQLTTLEQQGATTAALLGQLMRALQQAAAAQPELYMLLNSLLEVPRAYNPSIKLLTTLMSYALDGQASQEGKEPSGKRAQITVPPTKPVLQIDAPQAGKTVPPTKVSVPADKVPEASNPAPELKELSAQQWEDVLVKIKGGDAPLQSVLRHAQPDFDTGKQLLTLRFKYQLHRRRADDSKARNLLVKAMIATLGSAPVIATELIADAVPADTKHSATPPLDSVAQSVATLMGGGEPVGAQV